MSTHVCHSCGFLLDNLTAMCGNPCCPQPLVWRSPVTPPVALPHGDTIQQVWVEDTFIIVQTEQGKLWRLMQIDGAEWEDITPPF